MRPALLHTSALLLAVFLSGSILCAGDRTVGMKFAFNEFSASYQQKVRAGESFAVSVNLDMTGVISGEALYPGYSADILYVFEFAGKTRASGERIAFYAGPGFGFGYVRNSRDDYGAMIAMNGCIGLEYMFNVPVSLSLSLEPCLGVHFREDRFGEINMDFHKAGLISSIFPHLGIKYRF